MASWWVVLRTTCLPRDVYYRGVDSEKELWDRRAGEPSRAYEAFRTFVSLPSGDRTMVTAYRQFVGKSRCLEGQRRLERVGEALRLEGEGSGIRRIH